MNEPISRIEIESLRSSVRCLSWTTLILGIALLVFMVGQMKKNTRNEQWKTETVEKIDGMIQ